MLIYILGNFLSKVGGRGHGPPQPQVVPSLNQIIYFFLPKILKKTNHLWELFKKSGQERKARSKKKKKRRYEKRIIQETQSHKETTGGVDQKRQTMVTSNDFHVDLSGRLISTIFKINKKIIIQLKKNFIIFSS